MKTLGDRIKYLREVILGDSQGDMADAIGVSQMALSYWEENKRNPKGQQIDKIMLYCLKKDKDVNRQWLEHGIGKPNDPVTVIEPQMIKKEYFDIVLEKLQEMRQDLLKLQKNSDESESRVSKLEEKNDKLTEALIEALKGKK